MLEKTACLALKVALMTALGWCSKDLAWLILVMSQLRQSWSEEGLLQASAYTSWVPSSKQMGNNRSNSSSPRAPVLNPLVHPLNFTLLCSLSYFGSSVEMKKIGSGCPQKNHKGSNHEQIAQLEYSDKPERARQTNWSDIKSQWTPLWNQNCARDSSWLGQSPIISQKSPGVDTGQLHSHQRGPFWDHFYLLPLMDPCIYHIRVLLFSSTL